MGKTHFFGPIPVKWRSKRFFSYYYLYKKRSKYFFNYTPFGAPPQSVNFGAPFTGGLGRIAPFASPPPLREALTIIMKFSTKGKVSTHTSITYIMTNTSRGENINERYIFCRSTATICFNSATECNVGCNCQKDNTQSVDCFHGSGQTKSRDQLITIPSMVVM